MIRGSGGTLGNLAMLIKLGLGPAGIAIGYPDVNILAGIVVAERLYATRCPMFVSTPTQARDYVTGVTVAIDASGRFWFCSTG